MIELSSPHVGAKTQEGRTVYSIQALRAIAALMVVMEHSIYLWLARIRHTPNEPFWMNGAAGVDIFFVVSGFVMTISLSGLLKYRHPVRLFLKRRILRIVPLYWIATTLKIVLLLLLPSLALHQGIAPMNVLGSYLFLPVPNAEGLVVPVIVVGWTLNFEMFFYLIFALAMFIQRRILTVLVPVLGSLAILGLFFGEPSWPSISAFASPMLLEFLFGVVIARITSTRRPPYLISWILLIAGFLMLLSLCPHLPMPHEASLARWRFLIWGVPAASIVLGAVGLESNFAPIIPKWLISLGDASYAIYLVQTFFLPFVGIVIVELKLTGTLALAVSIVGSLMLSAVAGELTHRFVELPILRKLKRSTPLPSLLVVGSIAEKNM